MKLFSAIFFSLILLLQSAGLSFGTHYCGGQAVKSSLTIGTSDLDCGMALMAKGCDQHRDEGISKKNCCEDEFITLHSDNNFDSVVEFPVPTVIGKFVQQAESMPVLYASVSYAADYSKYAPPLLESDLNTLLQVFRI